MFFFGCLKKKREKKVIVDVFIVKYNDVYGELILDFWFYRMLRCVVDIMLGCVCDVGYMLNVKCCMLYGCMFGVVFLGFGCYWLKNIKRERKK